MSTTQRKRYWWLAVIPAATAMLAASSSLMVHAYRPQTFYSVAVSAPGEANTFSFDYTVDDESFTRAATVELAQLSPIDRAELDSAYAAQLLAPPALPAAGTQAYKATVAWQADPESPLDSCEVGLRDSAGVKHPARLAVSPNDDPGAIDANAAGPCQPQGLAGPVAIDVFGLDDNILPGPSKRPASWEMTYYVVANEGFVPTHLYINFGHPHEARLSVPAA